MYNTRLFKKGFYLEYTSNESKFCLIRAHSVNGEKFRLFVEYQSLRTSWSE